MPACMPGIATYAAQTVLMSVNSAASLEADDAQDQPCSMRYTTWQSHCVHGLT